MYLDSNNYEAKDNKVSGVAGTLDASYDAVLAIDCGK